MSEHTHDGQEPKSRRSKDEHGHQSATAPFAVKLTFEPRKEVHTIAVDEVKDSIRDGWFVWLDLDLRHEASRPALDELALLHPEILEDALSGEPATQVGRYERALHIAVTGCRLHADTFDLERTDIVVSDKYLVTLHRSSPHFLRVTKREYKDDFLQFAKSPSFLIYELWDHLIEDYLRVQKKFEERVERVQVELTSEADDGIFQKISSLGSDLLHFRKVLLPARSVLTELSTRKSPFISDATQTFLGNMVGSVERVLQDLLVDRDILSESLNLYMSMVSHRTNRVMNRLTVVSVIFLPLTFLCGVYGMNFDVLPELHWTYGYVFFWASVCGIVFGLVAYMRRKRLL
ncbi:MAG: magnesium transporter CorA family protein [Polyangiaceae bacterium]